MLTRPFLDAIEILETIEENGYKAYFVGGCVRDLILGHSIKDIDIATSAMPHDIQSMFKKVIPVGIEHGTVIVRHKHESYEVTTFRLDGSYTDRRHPDKVEFIAQIDQDLARRDFTINALAMNKKGEIIDLFGGRQDLTNKIIRTVGSGYERFMEDPLRIIRALRFTSQLGFSIEQKTLTAMKRLKAEIETIAVERILNEITRFFKGTYIDIGIYHLKSTKIYDHLPIFKEQPEIIKQLPKQMIPLQSFAEVIALFQYIAPSISIDQWSKAWKTSNQTKNEAIQLTKGLQYYENKGLDQWLVYHLKPTLSEGFFRLIKLLFTHQPIDQSEFSHMRESLIIRSKKDLAIDGNDIVNLFPKLRKGPWIQKIINRLEKMIVMGELTNNKNEIKEWIKCNPPETN